MGFFDSMKLTVRPQLSRTVFFPGNIVEGMVTIDVSQHAEFVGLRLIATGEEYVKVVYQVQRQRVGHDGQMETYYENEEVENETCIYRQVVTLAGQMETGGSRYAQPLPAGSWTYPFQLQLPTDIPPSMYSDKSKLDMCIRYNLEVVVDIPMGMDKTQRVPFTVLSPIPATQWMTPSAQMSDKNMEVFLCCDCCCSKGFVQVKFWMDRTVVALDRDKITIFAGVQNDCEEPVDALDITLVNRLTGRCHGKNGTSNETIATLRVADVVPSGEKKDLQGIVELRPLANPTASSINTTSTYTLNLSLDIPWASDPSASWPIVVAHSVDETNFLPAKNFGGYFDFTPHFFPETYYTPPVMQNPQYQCNMMPIQAPQGANMWAPPQQVFQTMPSTYFGGTV